MIKIQDAEGNDVFIIDDNAKQPRQVGEVKKKEDRDLDKDDLDEEEKDESDA